MIHIFLHKTFIKMCFCNIHHRKASDEILNEKNARKILLSCGYICIISVWYNDHTAVVTSHGSQMVYGRLTIISNAFSLMPRCHAATHSRLPHVSIIGVMRGSQLRGEMGMFRITKAPKFLEEGSLGYLVTILLTNLVTNLKITLVTNLVINLVICLTSPSSD